MKRQIFIVIIVLLFLLQKGLCQNNLSIDCTSYLKKTILIDSITITNNVIKKTDIKKIKKIISPYSGQTIISFSYVLNGAGIDCEGPTPIEVIGDKFSPTDLKHISKLSSGNIIIIGCIKIKTKDNRNMFLPTATFEIE